MLSRVVLLEAAVPLVAATVVAAAIAYGTSLLAFLRLAPVGTAIPQLGRDYYTIMGIGLVVAFGVITVTLPLLRRMTAPVHDPLRVTGDDWRHGNFRRRR